VIHIVGISVAAGDDTRGIEAEGAARTSRALISACACARRLKACELTS
jgi:hypothetical protein